MTANNIDYAKLAGSAADTYTNARDALNHAAANLAVVEGDRRGYQDIEDNLPVGATLTMRDRYASVTVRRTGERSYSLNGYETDHCGTPYDAGDALDFIFKWYGTCTRHTITRP